MIDSKKKTLNPLTEHVISFKTTAWIAIAIWLAIALLFLSSGEPLTDRQLMGLGFSAIFITFYRMNKEKEKE